MGQSKERRLELSRIGKPGLLKAVELLFLWDHAPHPTHDEEAEARRVLLGFLGKHGRRGVREAFSLTWAQYWRFLNSVSKCDGDEFIPRTGELDAACAAHEFPNDFDVDAASVGALFDDEEPAVGFRLASYGDVPGPDVVATGDDFDWFRFLCWKYGANTGAREFFGGGCFAHDVDECEALYEQNSDWLVMSGSRRLPPSDKHGNLWSRGPALYLVG